MVLKIKKCVVCRKKTLMNIKCKCGKWTCLTHKYPDCHNCQFDWKTFQRKKLEKENIKIKSHVLNIL